MIKKPKDTHHHGNLRQALIQAGMELLEEGGLDALTLRQCAARVGVSHAAPAHHFDGLRGLKNAIAAEGYGIFSGLMTEGIETAGPDSKDKLYGMCNGYVKFAIEHEALFNLMFVNESALTKAPERQEEAIAARKILTDTAAPFSNSLDKPGATQVAVWAMAHGYAKLVEIGRVKPGSGDARDICLDDILPILNLAHDET